MHDGRLVLVRDDRDLRVTLTPDAEAYAIRQDARVHVQVTDMLDRPPVAAVALSAVDEGLTALGLEQPGLERALARMGKAWDQTDLTLPPWTREALFVAGDARPPRCRVGHRCPSTRPARHRSSGRPSNHPTRSCFARKPARSPSPLACPARVVGHGQG